jgi:membrane protein implicated in regulation of membrane protease activity
MRVTIAILSLILLGLCVYGVGFILSAIPMWIVQTIFFGAIACVVLWLWVRFSLFIYDQIKEE